MCAEEDVRYGRFMAPLVIDRLPPHVRSLRAADALLALWIELIDETSRAEKISLPGDWTAAEQAAYAAGDSILFSRLRGYSEDEIARYALYLETHKTLATRYDEDTLAEISFLIHQLVSTPALEALVQQMREKAAARRHGA